MKQNVISLNGTWLIDYISNEPYISEKEPSLGTPVELSDNKNAVTEVPVPGYWEDMGELFRSTPLHTKLSSNPMYTLQRYPQTGYCPDMALPNPYGSFVYHREFAVDEFNESAECELYVGGVQNALSAWINGIYLGRYEGYSAAFCLKIPKSALKTGQNKITLAVSNNRLAGYKGRPVSGLSSRAANESTGGIWGDLELRFYPDGLSDVWVSTSEDLTSFTVKCVGGEQSNKTVSIFDGEDELFAVEIPKGESEINISSVGYSLWSPDSPKLYTAVVKTAEQTLSRRFGIRRLTADGIRLKLNGSPYFFRGTCEHLYQQMTVHPTRDKRYYRKVIRTLKDLGFNSIRFHTWVPMPEYMEAADELGIVIEVETPNNTTFAEWKNIVNSCRHYTSVCAYSSGNEMIIDDDYVEHLRDCSEYVHSHSDSLFSPMSAMRRIEYHWENENAPTGDEVMEPFHHNPKRLAALAKFCDIYNTYSLGDVSYMSTNGDPEIIDKRNSIYKKPLLTHEICIQGTYIDLSLEERYKGSRIGDTEFMSSVRRHLEDKGLIDKAPLYYRNSSFWQALQRKHCFETVRRCETFSGYDFLGDIDTHWHTFGYCVGMMNEFYELKPGETKENVLRYNGDAVLLCDLPKSRNVLTGSKLKLPVLVSNYGSFIDKATLTLRVSLGGYNLIRKEIRLSDIEAGKTTNIYTLELNIPRIEAPDTLKISARLSGGDVEADNLWELYVFPKAKQYGKRALAASNVTLCSDITANELLERLSEGERVVILGTGPFPSVKTDFQLSVAGRTTGHLATVISDHKITESFPHEGYCSWQFADMLNNGRAIILDYKDKPHEPVIDIATTYKNARREALLFECGVGEGRLVVCPMNLSESDPAAAWLKSEIIGYAMSDGFCPRLLFAPSELLSMLEKSDVTEEANANMATNKNDITM